MALVRGSNGILSSSVEHFVRMLTTPLKSFNLNCIDINTGLSTPGGVVLRGNRRERKSTISGLHPTSLKTPKSCPVIGEHHIGRVPGACYGYVAGPVVGAGKELFTVAVEWRHAASGLQPGGRGHRHDGCLTPFFSERVGR